VIPVKNSASPGALLEAGRDVGFEAFYTGSLEPGNGKASLILDPGRQQVIPDAILYSSKLPAPFLFPELILTPGEFRQWNNLLSTHAPGTNYGYVRVRCLNGINPFLALCGRQ
jgi:hypothetical protein